MSAGPLRRTAATLGLLALVPIAVLLITGGITPEEAAGRAVAVAVAVVLVGRAARMVLTRLVRRMERRGWENGAHPDGGSVRPEELTVAD